jgi:hypothetical protein
VIRIGGVPHPEEKSQRDYGKDIPHDRLSHCKTDNYRKLRTCRFQSGDSKPASFHGWQARVESPQRPR